MDDAQVVDLEEFKQLRSEINNRTTLGNNIFSFAVATIGAGFAAFDKYPDALLGLSIMGSWFWLLWLDHTGQVFKIAPYIAFKLAPRLKCGGQDTLGWEYFIRKLDSSGFEAKKGERTVTVAKTGATIGYAALVFGGAAPILMTIYWFAQMHNQAHDQIYQIRLFAMAFVIALWIFALYRASMLVTMMRSINDAILAAGETGRFDE